MLKSRSPPVSRNLNSHKNMLVPVGLNKTKQRHSKNYKMLINILHIKCSGQAAFNDKLSAFCRNLWFFKSFKISIGKAGKLSEGV